MEHPERQGRCRTGEDAAQAWRQASTRVSHAQDDLAALVDSIPESEWQSTDRQLYQQQARRYLQQLGTSATAAEVAGDMLSGAAAAIFAFATFAVGVAATLAVDAVTVGALDATIIGAPAGEAEGTAVGGACLAALDGANAALMGALSVVAGGFAVGAAVDTGFQVAQGDTAAPGEFTQAVIHAGGLALAAAPQEIAGYAEDKVIDHLRPENEDGGEAGAGEAAPTVGAAPSDP